METFKDRLNKLIREHNFSNYRLAKLLNISEATIRAWRQGTSVPKSYNFDRLATLLKVHPAWLRYGEKDRPPVFNKDVLEIALKIADHIRHYPKDITKIKKMVDLMLQD